MRFGTGVVIDMLMFNDSMVGALYTKKTIMVQRAAPCLGDENGLAERRGNFMKAAGLGMGCFLIQRDAADTMLAKFSELTDTRLQFHAANDSLENDGILRFFDGFDTPDDKTAGRLSEDLAFCTRWRQCGDDLWASKNHTMEHVVDYSHAANYLQMLAQKEAAGEIPQHQPMSLTNAAKAMLREAAE
jgi:hypothetical protein